ncbi:MAG: hypothetical protein FWG25_01225 [Promicromonosporaceae bacterium]|nr:hypothetical protein [Promicromonosporaceae bacterium]
MSEFIAVLLFIFGGVAIIGVILFWEEIREWWSAQCKHRKPRENRKLRERTLAKCRDCGIVGEHYRHKESDYLVAVCDDCRLATQIREMRKKQQEQCLARARNARVRAANQEWMDAQ